MSQLRAIDELGNPLDVTRTERIRFGTGHVVRRMGRSLGLLRRQDCGCERWFWGRTSLYALDCVKAELDR